MNRLVKKIFPVLLIALLLTSFIPRAYAGDDVTGHHHEKELRLMIEKDIMKGYGAGIYRPDSNVTRGQFAVIIARALHLKVPSEGIAFSDVTAETGVVDGVLAAANAGLITGYKDGTFDPTANISRQHMAVIVKRALDYMKLKEHNGPLSFADNNKIYQDYHVDIYNTVYYGIFKGSPKPNGLHFRPLDNATRGDAAAVMARFLKVVATDGNKQTYDTATIQEDGSTKVVQSFATYGQALGALKTGQIIQYGNAVIKMDSGIVVTKPTHASVLTTIFTTPDFTTGESYVSADTELEFVESTDKYVKIKVAGKPGFIKHENSILMPWKAVKGQSYYYVSKGELIHSIYLNSTDKYDWAYQIGKAPSFMNEGERYYSWDGYTFYNNKGEHVGTGYPYFQFLPVRSETNYTAAEIDAYVVTMLQKLEQNNPDDPTFKNAVQRSKLVGIGSYLKKIEAEKKVNALLILSLAQHEGVFGLSSWAQDYNNFFGLRIYDDRPVAEYFPSIEENINELVDSFLNKNYIPPNARYANGAVLGNKAVGFNVKYASDPYWGSKAAGHWYRMDKMMGGKDLANAYKVGMTNTVAQVKVQAGTENADAFTYNKIGQPVIIVGEANPSPWLKIKSDLISYDELYLHGDTVNEIPLIK